MMIHSCQFVERSLELTELFFFQSEDLLQPKRVHKEPRKRSSQTEVYHLPKEIFVFGETTSTTTPLKTYSDKKQTQMPSVVVVKDESRHEDDDQDLSEGIVHEKRSHPKSPRPSHRGRKFTFEGVSPVGTKSLQSGEVEDSLESYKPHTFVKKIPLVFEENSTIESINSPGNERDLFTPLSNVYTGPDYDLQMNVSDNAEADRRRDELLCALPTPQVSNPAFSGEKQGEDTGAINLTPLSPNFLNPFPFDEAATVQAGRLSSQLLADREEDKNYYSEPKPVSSDEADPDWFIEFQIKNGIIAENSGQDDESVTIADCNATFKEMCGIAAADDKQNKTLPRSPSEALGDHLKESGVGLGRSYQGETTDFVSVSNDAIEKANLLPEHNLGDNDNPPFTIEIHFNSTCKNDFQRSNELRAAAYAAAEEQVSVEESHVTGPSDLSASSLSMNTGNFRKVRAYGFGSSIPIIEAAPSDEMVASVHSKDAATDEKDASKAGQSEVQEPVIEEVLQVATCLPSDTTGHGVSSVAAKIETKNISTEQAPLPQSSELVTGDETLRRQAVEFKKRFARRFVRHTTPTGYSQAYLKSSTSEMKMNQPRKSTPASDGSKQTSNAASNLPNQGETKYDLGGHRNHGMGRKLQYVRPFIKDVDRQVPPTTAYAASKIIPTNSPSESNVFVRSKTSESPGLDSNLQSGNNKVNTACLLDIDDTRSISPAPSDEFEQRVAYTGCDVGKIGTKEWGTGNMISETASTMLGFQDDDTNVVPDSSQILTISPRNETEMIDVDVVGKPQQCSEKGVDDREIHSPPSADNSLVAAAEQRDDADETAGGVDSSEDWMEQIGTIMCAK